MSSQDSSVSPLNNLIVMIDREYGARDLGYDFLEALKITIQSYAYSSDVRAIMKALKELTQAVHTSRPRVALILRYCRIVLHFIDQHKDFSVGDFVDFIDVLIEETREKSQDLVRIGCDLVKDKSTILVHSRSNTVIRILMHCVKQGKRPRIIIAQQAERKTLDIIHQMDGLGISFTVVPEHVIAHVADDVDFGLFGALTYNCHDECVMGPGSAAVIAELHHLKIPCYIAMETDKFSLWQDQKKHHSLKTVCMQSTEDDIEYKKFTFSHDRVPMNWITAMITEDGILSPVKVRNIYRKNLAEKG